MSLEEAIQILKERNAINWQLIDGSETTDFDMESHIRILK